MFVYTLFQFKIRLEMRAKVLGDDDKMLSCSYMKASKMDTSLFTYVLRV